MPDRTDNFANPQVAPVLRQLRGSLATGMTLDAAVSDLRGLLGGAEMHESAHAALAEAHRILGTELTVDEILTEHTCADDHRQWYHGPREGSIHWPALRGFLAEVEGRDEDTIADIDRTSNEIVALLGDPAAELPFQRRGLVIGHVQSGKTANMTAVIAKAVDAGYNMIIVLSGLIEKLRQQTQARLDRDLIARHPGRWRAHTSASVDNDFRRPHDRDGTFVAHEGVAHLLVLKKTTLRSRREIGAFDGPLGRLEATFRHTPPAALQQFRVLVIDDECDQGSVNSANGDMDVSVINECIRRTLSHVPFVTYVGYTATPFANVLINPWPRDRAQNDGGQLDDLYPKSFITALPRPAAYFGPERIFGRPAVDVADADQVDGGLDCVRIVTPEEERSLQPASRAQRADFHPEMTESLEEAILYFIATCAARCARGDGNRHMTMLVHTSMYTDAHDRLAHLIQNWTGIQRKSLSDPSSQVSKRLISLFEREQAAVAGKFTELTTVSRGEILEHIPAVMRDLEFPIENGASDDRIDYGRTPRRYIVTGGSILARGLTLEGLVVSFFLRSSGQFDTLLQMGRWFGYRPNYEDMPRIWTTAELYDNFSELAEIEAHIRRDIERYSTENLTPMDLAVKIPAIPGMVATGAAKMKHARTAHIAYSNVEEQTTRFLHRDIETVEHNWKTGAALIDDMTPLNCTDDSSKRPLWRGVPLAAVRRFLEQYRPHEVQRTLDPKLLCAFLDEAAQRDRLLLWNVAAVVPVSRRAKEAPTASLGPMKIPLLQRSKMAGGRSDQAWIKTLMSLREGLIDLPAEAASAQEARSRAGIRELRREHAPGTPLLLLYPLAAMSPAEEAAKADKRAPMDAVAHLLGYGIFFPDSGERERDRIEVEVRPPAEEDSADAERAMAGRIDDAA